MKADFTTVIEAAAEGGYWAICPEVPGANGQGETVEEAMLSLAHAIELLNEDRELDVLLEQISARNVHPEIGIGERVGKEVW